MSPDSPRRQRDEVPVRPLGQHAIGLSATLRERVAERHRHVERARRVLERRAREAPALPVLIPLNMKLGMYATVERDGRR